MLRPYRVLDLANEDGILCGQLLADLGCDVIAIEPPGGSSARKRGPFAGDVRGAEHSLTWWAWARGKRSAVLDLDAQADRDELKRLAIGADFLIESAAPGQMASLGLGYADLALTNPALIYVSISAFGQDGPKAHYAAGGSRQQSKPANQRRLTLNDVPRAPLPNLQRRPAHAAVACFTTTLRRYSVS